jgi:uncharacterized alkaline shock family protein YloU
MTVNHNQLKNIDTKEFELPDTVFIRDIESRVFQAIVLQCLANIEGVALLEGNLIDSLLGRDSLDGVKGIHVEQEQKNHSVNIKVDINVAYGVCIPEKAEEIQTKIAQDVSRLTGLHVGCVHVVFKNLISIKDSLEELLVRPSKLEKHPVSEADQYTDEF